MKVTVYNTSDFAQEPATDFSKMKRQELVKLTRKHFKLTEQQIKNNSNAQLAFRLSMNEGTTFTLKS